MDSSKRNLNAMLEASLAYNVQYGLLTFVSNFIVPQARISPSLFSGHSALDLTCLIQELNRYLALKIKAYNNIVLADVEMIAASLGKKYFLDDIIYFYSHNTVISHDWAEQEREPDWAAPDRGRIEEISSLGVLYENRHEEFYRAVYRQIESGYRVVNQIDTVKVVIFDLDNTLWRGQVAQHYEPGRIWPNSHGWPVGMWEAVQQLRWRGILTSIVSKNDHDIVVSRWDDVVDLPFLKLSDFVNPRINWKHKAENISDLLREINITAKSALFVDDNPVERDSVKAALPGIRAIGANPFETRRILLWSPETQIAALTNESATRASMVKRQIERDKEMSAMTREEFLATLQCSISFTEIFSILQKDFTRALELTNKTNQFNTIGQRWNVAEINRYFSEVGRIFSFKVSDRFVDYGLVGVVFTKDWNITQYVMSCRVLGMDIEVAALSSIIYNMRENGSNSESIYGHVIETESNTPCRNVFLKTGFRLVANGEAYELPVDALPKRVGHVSVT